MNDPTRIPSHGDWQGPGPPAANIRRSGSLRRAATVTATDSESEPPAALSPIIQGLRSVTPSPYRLPLPLPPRLGPSGLGLPSPPPPSSPPASPIPPPGPGEATCLRLSLQVPWTGRTSGLERLGFFAGWREAPMSIHLYQHRRSLARRSRGTLAKLSVRLAGRPVVSAVHGPARGAARVSPRQ